MTEQHAHKQSKAVINRLSRLTGHLESVKGMVEEGRDCSDILIQISAVMSALSKVGQMVLEDHIRNCLLHEGSPASHNDLEKLIDAIDTFLGTKTRRIDGRH